MTQKMTMTLAGPKFLLIPQREVVVIGITALLDSSVRQLLLLEFIAAYSC
jgi:hypothetical protein